MQGSCKRCGQTFHRPPSSFGECCSTACARAVQKEQRPSRDCSHCGKTYRRPPSQLGEFCSQTCNREAKRAAREARRATCRACGVVYTPGVGNTGRFCSRSCFYATGPVGPRKVKTKGPRMRTAKGHPIAPPSGIVSISRLTLHEKIGPGEHPCHWCGNTVAWKLGMVDGALIADHLDWNQSNNSPENLVPSCHPCNAHRTRAGDRRRITEGEATLLVSGRPTRAVSRPCLHCGKPFLTVPSQDAGRIRQGRKPQQFCSIVCWGLSVEASHRQA